MGLLLMHLSLLKNKRRLLWNDYDIPILITLPFRIQVSIPLGKCGDLDKIVDGNIDI